jgi:hypothetical protein
VTSLFSLVERRAYLGPQPSKYEFSIPGDELLALVDVAIAAQRVVAETLMCPAGHLDALELALSKFKEEE